MYSELSFKVIELMKELEAIRGEVIDFDSILSQFQSSPVSASSISFENSPEVR